MSLYHDKQIRGFSVFMILFAFLFFVVGMAFGMRRTNNVKELFRAHDEAVASALLDQGVSREVITIALTNTEIGEGGQNLLAAAGMGIQSENHVLPFIRQFQRSTFYELIIGITLLCVILAVGILLYFWKRKRLLEQAGEVLINYINGDYSRHLPQNSEGAICQIFTLIEQLATMLQSRNETGHETKRFLKSTISDISHQLKTPLAALAMYQEIIENEPDNAETVKEFSIKIGAAVKRMEQLIQSMLKITRLDSGNIVFEKACHSLTELIALSINELTTRAKSENKRILIAGDSKQQIICDLEWTSEAIGNIVKNALDHTKPGGTIQITWEHTPVMFRIFIADNGCGIAPENIHHIFKRFYRSRYSLDTQGIGLGLPLAKSIIEGQGGVISVQSEQNAGTTFMIAFLTES